MWLPDFFLGVSHMLNCLFSFFFTEILSNLGSPHSVHEDAEKQPQADVKEGKNYLAAWM